MRGFKLAAIAIGALIALLLVGTVVGTIIHALIDVAIAAAVVGAIVIGIKIARSNRQVQSKPREREVRDSYTASLPQADLDRYTTPSAPAAPPRTTAPAAPRTTAPSAAQVDDELARLKREMGS